MSPRIKRTSLLVKSVTRVSNKVYLFATVSWVVSLLQTFHFRSIKTHPNTPAYQEKTRLRYKEVL